MTSNKKPIPLYTLSELRASVGERVLDKNAYKDVTCGICLEEYSNPQQRCSSGCVYCAECWEKARKSSDPSEIENKCPGCKYFFFVVGVSFFSGFLI